MRPPVALGSSPELFAFTMSLRLALPVRCVFALVVISRQWVLSESRGPLNRHSYGFGERADLRCRIFVVCVEYIFFPEKLDVRSNQKNIHGPWNGRGQINGK